jgi:fumarate reductase subunit D
VFNSFRAFVSFALNVGKPNDPADEPSTVGPEQREMNRTSEPLWWSLFAAGGQVSAFFTPATAFLTGIAVPAGLISAPGLFNLVHHPLTRLYLFLVISLPLFHGAHRTLTTLAEIGLKGMRQVLAFLLYGAAVVGTVVAAVLLVRM